jgi:hypothetical protein
MPEVTALVALPSMARVAQPKPCVSTPAASGSTPSSVLGVAVAVALADGVAAGGQRRGFLVVHRHAGEGLAHLRGGLPGRACR